MNAEQASDTISLLERTAVLAPDGVAAVNVRGYGDVKVVYHRYTLPRYTYFANGPRVQFRELYAGLLQAGAR